VHPLTGRPAPAADVLGALLEHLGPALADAGDERRVADGVTALLRRGTGADLQRAVHRRTGDLAAVTRAAVAATAGEAATG
jgi:carboxylate-amine ligase